MRLNKKYPYYNTPHVESILDIILYQKDNNPNGVAITYKKDEQLVSKTYENLYHDVTLLSNYFNHEYHNKRIALIGENSYNWLVTFMSIILSGNICVIIDKDAGLDKIKELLKKTDTKIVYYSEKYASNISEIRLIKHQTIDDLGAYYKIGGEHQNKYKIDIEKDAAIFFTSGTMGANKAVLLNQKSIVLDIIGASSLYLPEANSSVVSFLPFHHAFGLITAGLMPIYYGVRIHINDSLKNLLTDLSEQKPYTLFAVPLFIENFYKQIWKTARKNHQEKALKRGIRISNALLKIGIDKRAKFFRKIQETFGGHLEYIICGGAYLDPSYVKWFRSIGIEILNGYGITECSPVISVNRNFYKKDGSVGVPCKGVKVKIIDGEICVKSDIVMKGYYKDHRATRSVIKDGYFYTGDLGYIDEDGFIFITGRKKNLIILSNGENISPELLENALIKDKGVEEVVVYSKDNKIVAEIFPTEDYIADQEYFDELIYKYNQDKAKNHQIAYAKLRTTEFKKNSSKKIIRSEVGKE